MAACRQLGFDVTGSSAIRSAGPENPTLEPNMKCVGSPVGEIWPFAYLGAYGTPIFGKGEVVGVSNGTIRKSDGDRCAISNHSATICDGMSPTLKSYGGGSLLAKISGWSRPLMFGYAESEHHWLTNGEIISEELQYM